MSNNMHLHIALVGGSPTPVYQGIVHETPNQVILVCSQQSEKTAKNIKKELPWYKDEAVIIYPISDNNVETMYKKIEELEQTLPSEINISLNLSGGMKPWTIIFYNVFLELRPECQIFCLDQNGMYFDMIDMVTRGKVDFDMDSQFRILGHKLIEFMPLTDYTELDFEVLDNVASIGLNNLSNSRFSKITASFYKKYKEEYEDLNLEHDFSVSENNSTLSWNSGTHSFECKLGENNYTFASEHVEHIVLNTGWFELYVARMIAQKYGAENIRMNCIFYNNSDSLKPKNEIDIIVNTGNKLIFVECKTQILHTTDIDKFRSAVLNYGGLGSKPLFVTNCKMNPEGLEKCRDLRIDTFYLENEELPSYQDRVKSFGKKLQEIDKNSNM